MCIINIYITQDIVQLLQHTLHNTMSLRKPLTTSNNTLKPSTANKIKSQQKVELTVEQRNEIREAFELFDTDGSNTIDIRELRVAMRALGYECNKDELNHIIHTIDTTGNNTIDLNTFINIMSHKLNERDSNEELLKAFRLFDDDDTGKITLKNLRRVAREIGESMTDEELMEMINEADRNGDGEIDQDEFLRIMNKTSLY